MTDQRPPSRFLRNDNGARICIFPGCGEVIMERNNTGLCSGHRHAEGLCGCSQCAVQGRAGAAYIRYVTCAYPGCPCRIEPNSVSKVCKQHSHRLPYCHCAACIRRGSTAPAPRRVIPGTKVVEVPYAGTSGVFTQKAAITMPLAPWDRP